MKSLALPFAGLLLLAAHATAQSKHIHEDTDPYTGLRTLSLETSTHGCPGDPSRGIGDPDLHLLFIATQNQNHTLSYFITPELDRGGYTLALRPKGTMDAMIDGAVFNLTTYTGSATVTRHWLDHSYPHESIPFAVAQSDLEHLSQAQSFQFRINGARVGLQRCSDAKRLHDLAEFLDAARSYGLPELGSNTGSSPLVEEINPSSKLKTISLEHIATAACPGDPALTPHDADVQLVIWADQRKDGGVWYFISTDLSQGQTLSLPRSGKLFTQIGGISGSFHTINGSVLSSRTDLSGKPIWNETTAFHVHQSDLVPLAKGADLDLRIEAPSGEVHRCAPADQFAHLGEFITVAATYQASR